MNQFNNAWSEDMKLKMPSFDGTDFWECVIQVTNTPSHGESILVNTSVAFDGQRKRIVKEKMEKRILILELHRYPTFGKQF